MGKHERRSSRHAIKAWAFVQTGKADFLCHLMTISTFGASLSVPKHFSADKGILSIEIDGEELLKKIPFTVISKDYWVGTEDIKSIGIEFKKPISSSLVESLLESSRRIQTQSGI